MNESGKPPLPRWVVRLIAAGILVFAAGIAALAYWATRPEQQRAGPGVADAPLRQAASPPLEAGNQSLLARGKGIYERHCAACHGANLEGQPNWQTRPPGGRMPAPPHDDSGHTWHHPDEVLFGITKHGVKPPYGPPGYQSDMPAFQDTLSDEDIRAVLAFIKSKWSPKVHEWREEMLRNRNR